MAKDLDGDLDLDLDWDWARELFDRTRGAGEPGFVADPAALARAGDRRRRLRTVGAGSGLLGVVAVTAAVAIGLGAGTTDAGSQPGPGGAWGNRPLSDVFKYVTSFDAIDKTGHAYVPATAVADLAAVMGRLDPSFTHLVGSHDRAHDPRIVADGGAHAQLAHLAQVSSVWVDDSPRQSGELTFGFASNTGWAQLVGVGGLSSSQPPAPCSLVVSGSPASSAAPSQQVQWSSCTVSHLQDGSTIASTSGRVGPGTITVALREFADGEVFTVVAQDFATAMLWQGTALDPATVVKPTPWTEQSLVAALADPAVRSGWNPMSPPNSSGRLLLPADIGKGWSFDTGKAREDTTQEYLYFDGCGSAQNVPVAKPGSETDYWGPLPNGVSGTASEGEYVLRSGSGVQTMAKARSAVQSGCADAPVGHLKDTVIALPAGIGDEAFAESVPDLGMVSVNVRIGDTILRTDLSNVNHVRDQSWTDKTPLDLTSSADRQWLADIARSMVARHTGEPSSPNKNSF